MDAKGNEDYLVRLNVTPMVSLGVRRDTMPKNTFQVPATLTNCTVGGKSIMTLCMYCSVSSAATKNLTVCVNISLDTFTRKTCLV